jgi:hypothetical protein
LPHRIGPYRILRKLGSGGMGVVYLGRDESSGTLAAVKVLHPENAADPLLLARLRREMAAARRVPRFCTAPVIAADLAADQPYVATEYIAGPTLAEAVTRRGKLTGGDLEGLALGVAMALQAIHDHRVVHRDLKPSNIMLSSVGPRVIDFGIARLGPVGTRPGATDTQLTLTGQMIGTVPYMAPEQVRGEEATAAADVFAWAGVLAYAATGRPPFGSDDATPRRILTEAPVVHGIDEPLWGLVLGAFRTDPSSRPTAAELVTHLSRRRPMVADQVREKAAEPAQRLPSTLVDPELAGAGPPGGPGAGGTPTAAAADAAPTVVRPAGPPLAAQLAELLDAGRVMAAHRLVSGLAPEETPAECRELAARARAMAGQATALRDRAVATTDPDLAWQLLDEAEAQAPDLADLAELRLRRPPHRAGTPAAHLTGTGVLVTWPASPSRTGHIRYRTLRATGPFPPGDADGDLMADGDPIAEGTECRAHDRTPPVNTPLHYAVVAQRGGVAAPPAATPAPVWFRPEVTDLRVTPGDGLVAAAWHPPPAAARVSVRRGTGGPPRDAADGSPIEPSGAGFVDRGLPAGVRQHYLVTVVYLAPDGTEWHTEGERFSAVPARPPEPVRELRLDPVEGEPGWLRAGFPPPGWGTVELRELAAPPEQPLGARLPASQLPGRPVAAVPVAGGLKLLAPAGPAVLLAATVSGELAAIGAHREWRQVPVPAGLRALRRGDELLLTWQWPAEVGVVQVCWRAATGGTDRPPWQCQRVTAAQYRVGGGATVRPHGARRYDVSVASLLPGAYQELTGAPATTTVEVPVTGEYTISWQGWPDRQLTVTVTARQPVRVPRLVLVAAAEWPLSPAGGEPLAEADDVALGPAQPWRMSCREPARRRPYWLRCFAPGGPVELRDPPRDQLRLG